MACMIFFKKIRSGNIKTVNKSSSFEFLKDNAPNQIGVYVMRLNGEIKYVGCAIEDTLENRAKGLRKRLQEHWEGISCCKGEIFKHRHRLAVSLIVSQTVEEAKRLEGQLIRKYNTIENGWNLRDEDCF